MAWKVEAVEARPSRPASNFMVGVQDPKSSPAMVEAWNPANVPVTASVTDPAPAAGAVQTKVDPDPVQVPAAAVELDVEAAELATFEATAIEEDTDEAA